jgi:hypothetical protein
MSGSLFNLVKRDAKRFINTQGYQVDITLTTPDGSLTINFTGWAVKHHISFDSDGNQVNTKTVRSTIDEDVLVANGYPVRKNGEISLLKHRLDFVDSSGVLRNYYIRETYPDENLGLIHLILGDFIP